MTLQRRIVITALVVAVPAAAIALTATEWRRSRDRWLALERVAASFRSDIMRETCETDSQWFLAGPRVGRPTMAERQIPDPDVFLPRPNTDERPFEIFAYSDQYAATSTAGPRFPEEFRRRMRSSPPTETTYGTYESASGTGIQMAYLTGWTPGPCAVLLFRMQPVPGLLWQRIGLYVLFAGVAFGAMMLAFTPTLRRIRRSSQDIAEAAKSRYGPVAPDNLKDDISRFAFVFNEAAAEIHRRRAENADRIEALRRHIAGTEEGVIPALVDLEELLGLMSGDGDMVGREVLGVVHDAAMRLENLVAAARLRLDNQPLPRETGDVTASVRRVVERHRAIASAAGVTLDTTLPVEPVHAPINPLFERAVANLVDNAIRYNHQGGRVDVTVVASGAEAFAVRVTDTGRGVTDEELNGLTAIRRFRGDEATSRRANMRGLGLAVALEIADRSGLELELRKPPSGGFEAEIRTKS